MAAKQNLATKTDIKRVEKKVDGNSASIKLLTEKVDGNSASIKLLTEKVDGNSKDIKVLSVKVDTNRYQLENRMDVLEERVEKMLVKFRDEILNHIDPVMKELEASRQERTILGHQIDGHEKRITRLETAGLN